MDAAATIVWVAERAAADDAPNRQAKRSLDAWAKAQGVVLAPPSDARPPATDWAIGEAVERELAHVRDALAGLEFDGAERALARAEALLRNHAELPNAPWLRAEVERAWSARWLRQGDEERATRAWQRAAGLDGGREPGLGERAFGSSPAVSVNVAVAGLGEGATVRLDGKTIRNGEVNRSEGEHVLSIVDAVGRTTWAEWVAFVPGSRVHVDAPPAPACSLQDMSGARLAGAEVTGHGVRCASWVAAVAEAGGVVLVTTCKMDLCSPLTEWRTIETGSSGWTFAPGNERAINPPTRSRWPTWATWTLAAVGVVGTTIGVAAAAGGFKGSTGPETQFVNGGLAEH